ncbi:cytochrome c [Variovorax sp. J22R133]|uniref:c-type cytochrome n=1 Tax=Variovorax brevis TaxID=3053503 RepID=UPI002574D5B7|nr:cytochrome c [Variovorax sp. J22R133]MDM0115608.1 cytochrome c [Variovorax sp. J22R133]
MIRFASLLLAGAGALLAIPASAQFAKTEDAIHYRQSAMTIQGTHFGRIGAMVNGRVPYDAAAAVANAEIMAVVVKLPWQGFGPGTEGGKAKPEIWKEQAKFKEISDKLVVEVDKLLVAAKGGNLDALKAQFAQTGDTCKSCHDAFRNK